MESLSKLVSTSVIVSPGSGAPEPGMASVELLFTDGTRLEAEYWRLVEDGAASYSSFDHQQLYGLPARIDAVAELRMRLSGKIVTSAVLDRETGDLMFEFTGQIKLQVLNVTGYEIWVLRFPNGAVDYSNHSK
jgi:hypothetical protein